MGLSVTKQQFAALAAAHGHVEPEPIYSLLLSVPFPPTLNTYWRHVGHKVLISAKGRAYRKAAIESIQKQHAAQAFCARLHVTIILCPPDRRLRDLDNYVKVLADACTHAGLWGDDEQIDHLEVLRGKVIRGGHVSMQIAGIAGENLYSREIER